MGKDSKIEWTDHTFNAWIGCQKVSPGCQHCYAETLMDKRMGRAKWGPDGTRVRTSAEYWRQPLRWDHEAAMHASRERVFCASLADVFEDRPELDDWRIELFDLIGATPHLDWLVLTKRPENITEFLFGPRHGYILGGGDYYPNLGLGTSVEDQARADERIPHLLRAQGGALRFLSCEPLLGPVELDLCRFVDGPMIQPTRGTIGGKPMPAARLACIDWVIVGGESGPKARPMHPDWARSIRDQCREAGVPFFFKQMDKKAPIPDDLMIREFPAGAFVH